MSCFLVGKLQSTGDCEGVQDPTQIPSPFSSFDYAYYGMVRALEDRRNSRPSAFALVRTNNLKQPQSSQTALVEFWHSNKEAVASCKGECFIDYSACECPATPQTSADRGRLLTVPECDDEHHVLQSTSEKETRTHVFATDHDTVCGCTAPHNALAIASNCISSTFIDDPGQQGNSKHTHVFEYRPLGQGG